MTTTEKGGADRGDAAPSKTNTQTRDQVRASSDNSISVKGKTNVSAAVRGTSCARSTLRASPNTRRGSCKRIETSEAHATNVAKGGEHETRRRPRFVSEAVCAQEEASEPQAVGSGTKTYERSASTRVQRTPPVKRTRGYASSCRASAGDKASAVCTPSAGLGVVRGTKRPGEDDDLPNRAQLSASVGHSGARDPTCDSTRAAPAVHGVVRREGVKTGSLRIPQIVQPNTPGTNDAGNSADVQGAEDSTPSCTAASPPEPVRMLDMVLCFDVTLSMTPVLNNVRDELTRLTATMFDASVADVRVAVIAHGDYDCSLLVRTLGFTNDAAQVRRFIEAVPVACGGWNDGECYEEALRVCSRELAWRTDAKKVVVVVGDDIPHGPTFPTNAARTDWHEELRCLTESDTCVFAVQCASLSIPRAEPFYRALAQAHCSGRYLLLTQFYMMSEMALGIFHSARNDMHALGDHEQALVQRGMHNAHVARAFASLRGEDPPDACEFLSRPVSAGGVGVQSQGLVPVPPGRFQVIPVVRKQAIKVFVQKCGAVFRKGSGFYQLRKAENISQTKEIMLENVSSGDMFSGHAARRILGVPDFHQGSVCLCPNTPAVANVMRTYNIFVQTTSYNRTLEPGTRFLYEIDQV